MSSWIVLCSDDVKGFEVLPKRWIVECAFAWLGLYRRLSKDYEQLLEKSQSMVFLASIHHLLERLAPAHLFSNPLLGLIYSPVSFSLNANPLSI